MKQPLFFTIKQNGLSRPGQLLLLIMTLLLVFYTGNIQATVAITPEPLTVQEPLEPNILFILDDSGSMNWEFMPDSGFDHSPDYDKEYDQYRNSDTNLIYYDPNTTYTPPPKADGSSWPNASYPNAKRNGFCTGSCTTSDIFNYGYYDNVFSSKWSSNTYATDPDGDHINAFVYTTKSGNTYTEYYIAQDCTGSTSANSLANCDDSAAAQQNVANWFSYYRRRDLLAKSAAMTAFKDLNPDYRFGYGELNGNERMKKPASSYNKMAIYGDGSTGTRKKEFYDWLAANTSGSGTPLQRALLYAGEYFSTDHPWLTDLNNSSSDKYACRQSFSIVTSDGFWNSYSASIASADRDQTDGPTVTGPNSISYTYSAVAPYVMTAANNNNLADIAMKYWKNDLRPAIDNEVPTGTEDPAFWQHMVTFTIGLGLTPVNISPAGTTVDQIFGWANGTDPAISGFSWPTPSSSSVNNVADMAHAALNGHGGFFSAKNPQEFTDAINAALDRAAERVGSAASLAANSTKLDTGVFTYQANYFTGKWKGDLKAFAVDAITGAIALSPSWSAETQLPAHGSRNLKAYNPSGSTYAQQFVDFSDPADLNSAQQTALGTSTSERQNLINYMRGDDAQEEKNSGPYRTREAILGDIVDSQPVYVGKPSPNLYSNKSFTGQSSYFSFASSGTAVTRDAVLYVAGNDGYLHGFNATTGVELFGYMPAAVILNGFSSISDPDYGVVSGSINVPHQYYNDGELTVADVYFSASGGSWKTVLVGTTGRGESKSVYALDITDPTDIKFLWERYAADGKTNSNYIGQVTGKPIIAQTDNGVWSVIMGNGYNSSTDKAALLQFDITDGDLSIHTAGSATSNGLAAPALLDFDNDGIQDYAAAGDLNGKVWTFSGLDSVTPATPGTGSNVFTATDSSGNAQPITAGLLSGIDPSSGDVWMFFGTGKYLHKNDLLDLSEQTWYGIIVSSSDSTLVTNLTANGRSALVQRDIELEVPASGSNLAARGFSKGSAGDMSGKSGWFMDLTTPISANAPEGERMTTPNQFQGTALIGTSRIPEAVDACNTTGRGWVMALDPFTGTNMKNAFFDFNGDGLVNSSDVISDGSGNTYPVSGIGFESLPNNPIFVGNKMLINFDDGTNATINTSGGGGAATRESWRELIN